MREFKNYTVDREIGKGGMATVFLAHEQGSGRPVALKFLLPHVATNQVFVRQFLEEFRANQLLRHANIVEAIDGGEHEGQWFMAMEFLDGGSLKELLAERRALPLDLAVHVALNVLKGLQHSHQCGIVHQDVKPANLMVQHDGSIKIADFGISRIASPALWTATGKVRGTPSYMAPEQAAGKEPTYRWDIFSTGVVLYEMLAGFNPFGARDPQEALRKITGVPAPPLVRALPALPLDVEVLVARMLEKDPARRYQNVDAVLGDVQKLTARLQLAYSQDLFRDWQQDAPRVEQFLAARRSRFHLDNARRLLAAGKAMADLAVWEAYRAGLADRTNQEALGLLQSAAREHGFSLQKSDTMDIKRLETRLAEQPDDIATLLQVARLHRGERSVLQAFFLARTALALAPFDPGVQAQVEKLLGPGKIAHL